MRIQQFELVKELGNGRYGKVHLVKHRSTGFLMAMKIISIETIEETNVWT
jgi:aurora kinase